MNYEDIFLEITKYTNPATLVNLCNVKEYNEFCKKNSERISRQMFINCGYHLITEISNYTILFKQFYNIDPTFQNKKLLMSFANEKIIQFLIKNDYIISRSDLDICVETNNLFMVDYISNWVMMDFDPEIDPYIFIEAYDLAEKKDYKDIMSYFKIDHPYFNYDNTQNF